jgi:hypothetical protein
VLCLGKLLILVQRYIQACHLDARYDKKGNVHVMQNFGAFESLCPDLFPLIWQGTQAHELYCHVLNTLLLLSTIRNRNNYYKSILAKETVSFLLYCCTMSAVHKVGNTCNVILWPLWIFACIFALIIHHEKGICALKFCPVRNSKY